MHSTPHARLALVCLLTLLGTAVLARLGAARPSSAAPQLRQRRAPVTGPLREGNALRDGHALDLNFASAVELELLPGVGPRLARDIVDRRERSGPFRALPELLHVRGIGEKTLAKIAPFLQIDSERVASEHVASERVASKRLEHAAEAKREVGGAAQPRTLEQQRAPQIDAEHPAARKQVVDAQHEVAAGP